MQDGDVLLRHTPDNGDITIADGVVEFSGGLATAVYLSLFGGNEDDDGRDGNPLQWWGNLAETEPARQYRSETQFLLRSLPAIPFNLRRIEDAVRNDLQWLLDVGAATGLDVAATIPALNRVCLTITVEGQGDPSPVQFIENWRADA